MTQLPASSDELSKAEAIKMLYLVSGWLHANQGDISAVSYLDRLALKIHDAD